MGMTKTAVKEHRWQQLVRRFKSLRKGVPLAVGVDRGSRWLKIVVLGKKGKKLTVHDASIHSVADGALLDEESSAESVKAIQKKINAHFNRIGTSLSGSEVFVKTISLPVMTEREVRDHLTLEN